MTRFRDDPLEAMRFYVFGPKKNRRDPLREQPKPKVQSFVYGQVTLRGKNGYLKAEIDRTGMVTLSSQKWQMGPGFVEIDTLVIDPEYLPEFYQQIAEQRGVILEANDKEGTA